jgi:hypothetical protein
LEKALAEEGSDASDGSGGGGDRVASWARDAQRAWGAPPSPPCAAAAAATEERQPWTAAAAQRLAPGSTSLAQEAKRETDLEFDNTLDDTSSSDDDDASDDGGGEAGGEVAAAAPASPASLGGRLDDPTAMRAEVTPRPKRRRRSATIAPPAGHAARHDARGTA